MSDFRFAKSTLPRQTVLFCGYGIVVGVGIVGLMFAIGNDARKSRIADMHAQIANAQNLTTFTPNEDFISYTYYTGETPQLAQISLQRNLQELADAHNVAIEVISPEQIEVVGNSRQLNLTLSGAAPEEDLGAFLHGLATLEPLVAVKALSLRRARATRGNNANRVAFQAQLYGLSLP